MRGGASRPWASVGEVLGQRGQAERARPALTRALVGHPAHDALGLGRPHAVRGSTTMTPAPTDAPEGREGLVGVRRVEVRGVEPRPAVAAERGAPGVGVGARRVEGSRAAACPARPRAPGALHRARHRDERRAGAARRAEAAEPVGAESRDQRDVGAGLGVVEQHRGMPDAQDVRATGSVLGERLVVVEPVDERRLLAGDVAVRRRVQVESRASQASALALVDRALMWLTVVEFSRETQTTISLAPMTDARASAPSRTRWGFAPMSVWSLCAAGSPSIALTTMTLWCPRCSRMRRALRNVGKAAPPRPVRPDASRWSRRLALRAGRRRSPRAGPARAVARSSRAAARGSEAGSITAEPAVRRPPVREVPVGGGGRGVENPTGVTSGARCRGRERGARQGRERRSPRGAGRATEDPPQGRRDPGRGARRRRRRAPSRGARRCP